jgi:hypothetical protein
LALTLYRCCHVASHAAFASGVSQRGSSSRAITHRRNPAASDSLPPRSVITFWMFGLTQLSRIVLGLNVNVGCNRSSLSSRFYVPSAYVPRTFATAR